MQYRFIFFYLFITVMKTEYLTILFDTFCFVLVLTIPDDMQTASDLINAASLELTVNTAHYAVSDTQLVGQLAIFP